MLNLWFRIMHCCIPTPTTDSNTSTGMIWVTLNMRSATEECREPSGNCPGISHCLESGRRVNNESVPLESGRRVNNESVPLESGRPVNNESVPLESGRRVNNESMPLESGRPVNNESMPFFTGLTMSELCSISFCVSLWFYVTKHGTHLSGCVCRHYKTQDTSSAWRATVSTTPSLCVALTSA